MPVSLRYCLNHWGGKKKCGNMVSLIDRYCNECKVLEQLEKVNDRDE